MTLSKFKDFPTELVENCTQNLEIPDLMSFQLTCRQIHTQVQLVVKQRFFETWETSLMGTSLRKLEEVSMDNEIRKYVKHIHIEDDCVKDVGSVFMHSSSSGSNIWPRGHDFLVKSHKLGIANLKTMLLEKRFKPDTIRVRETYTLPNPEPAALLLQDIIQGADLAVLSVQVYEVLRSVTGATVHLSSQHRGQGVGFSMLRKAVFCFVKVKQSWWSDQLFYEAPNLEDLALSFMNPWRGHWSLLSRPPIFKLRRLNLFQLSLPAHLVLEILTNSKESLADLTFNMMRLEAGSTWNMFLLTIGSDFPLLTSFKVRFVSEEVSGNVNFGHLSKEKVAEQFRPGLEIGGRGFQDDEAIRWVHYNGPGGDGVVKTAARFAVASFED